MGNSKHAKRTTTGKFPKGASGNPAGRPAGSRNKATLLCEQLLEGGAEELILKALQMAKSGDVRALALCLDRILPIKRDRCINLELRPIQGPQDVPIAFQDITAAIAEGRITPGEGESLSNIVETHSRFVPSVDFDRRLAHLEGHVRVIEDYRSELDEFMTETREHDPMKDCTDDPTT
jgi:hypothetical protein